MPANLDVVRTLFRQRRTPPERQVEQLLQLWRRSGGSDFGVDCLAEAERVAALLQREASVRRLLAEVSAAAGGTAAAAVLPDRAPRHFVWLGDRRGIHVEVLRSCIASLAEADMISSDFNQREALRRGLGVTVNDDERRSDAPWVLWRGPVDVLWLIVEGLWRLGLVTCGGGRQQKWRTAAGVFLHSDGTPFDLSLKNSRCSNAGKIRFVRSKFLVPLAGTPAETVFSTAC